MQSKKKRLSYIPDVNKYTGRTRTLAVCTNKYLKNNETLKNIWESTIDYNKKPFELKPSVENQIKELQSCIKKQEDIINIKRRKVLNDIKHNMDIENDERKRNWRIETVLRKLTQKNKKDLIQKYWRIPESEKTMEINKSKWYVSEHLQKAYQYLRPFPDNLLRRWYSTEWTWEPGPNWELIKHAPERMETSTNRDRINLPIETMNYWIAFIHYTNNEYIKNKKRYAQQMSNKERLSRLWITEENIKESFNKRKEALKEQISMARDNLYNIINNPRNPNRETEWDYDPSQHWVIHTFIWLIYY